VCSVEIKSTLQSIPLWTKLIRNENPDATIFLIANKTDLRKDLDREECVEKQDFISVKKREALDGFAETSCKEWQDGNVITAFDKALAIAVKRREVNEKEEKN